MVDEHTHSNQHGPDESHPDSLRSALLSSFPHGRESTLFEFKEWLSRTKKLTSIEKVEDILLELRGALPEYADDTIFLDAIRDECVRRKDQFDIVPDKDADLYGPVLSDGKGRYRLVKQIGAGSQGRVYKAIDRQFVSSSHAVVAIKIFNQSGIFEGVRAKSVEHPHVVRVLDQGVDPGEGTPFVVYCYLDGLCLARWSQNRNPTQNDILSIMISLCEGVGAIHAASIVHRDLKPSNILFNGIHPTIVDFGIASEGLKEQFPAGSPAYMAPEQMLGVGESQLVDIYGLGGILYYLVTGLYPNINGKPISPESYTQIKPKRMRAIIRKCLEHDPKSRYQSAWLLARDLEALRDHRPLAISRPSIIEHTKLAFRRSFLLKSTVAIIGILLTVMSVTIYQQIQTTNELLTFKQGAIDRDESMRSGLQTMTLGAMLRDEIDPSGYWMITELRTNAPDIDWTLDLLTSETGAELLRREIWDVTSSGTESDIMLGFWWLLLGRVQALTDADQGLIDEAYNTSKSYFLKVLDEDDALLQRLEREYSRRSSKEPG